MKGCCILLLLCLIGITCFLHESQGAGGISCQNNQLQCDDFQCIQRESWCDKEIDCTDGSDEAYCNKKVRGWFGYGSSSVNTCKENHFECISGPCFPVSVRCDGFEDCRDDSDENYCDETEEKISEEGFDNKEATYEISAKNESDDISGNLDSERSTTYEISAKNEPDDISGNFDSELQIEVVEEISPPSNATPEIQISALNEDYYYKRRTESMNDSTRNFNYNRPVRVHLLYKNGQQGNNLQTDDTSRVGQTPLYSSEQYGSHLSNSGYNERQTGPSNSQHGSYTPNHYNNPVGQTYPNYSQHQNYNYSQIYGNNERQTGPSSNTNSHHGSYTPNHPYNNIDQTPSFTNNQDGGHSPNYGYNSMGQRDTRYANSPYINAENNRPSSPNSRSTIFPVPIYVHYIQQPQQSTYAPPKHVVSRPKPAVSPNVETDPRPFRNFNPSQPLTYRKFFPQKYIRTPTSSSDYAPESLVRASLPYNGNNGHNVQSDYNKLVDNGYKPFHFRTNYTEKFRNAYKYNVQRAERWIIDQRNTTYSWGEDTPRALIALSLATNTFSYSYTENELMKKSLTTRFGIKMLEMRKNSTFMSNSTFATYVNALLATCQDPKRFFGHDVTMELSFKKIYSSGEVNPLVYLTLCLTNTPIEYTELHSLINLLHLKHQDERSYDMQILAITALACFQRQDQYREHLKDTMKGAFQLLLDRRLPDNSFGSVYSTALAAQALMSIDLDINWNIKRTMDFLIEHQKDDGSFGDMLATYYVLPAISGRSLLHLRNTHCDPVIEPPTKPPVTDCGNESEPKISIYYTIKVGYPERSSKSSYLQIPQGENFFCAMRKARDLNPQFSFSYKEMDNGKIDVHTITDIPDDTERGFKWNLYVVNATEATSIDLRTPYWGFVSDLYPREHQEFIYWYLPWM